MTDREQLASIYTLAIGPTLFRNSTPSEPRSLILVGGQSGSGKTHGGSVARRLHGAESITPIIGDDLRLYHPDFGRLLAEDHLGMPTATAAALSQWVESALEEARAKQYSSMVEGTFRRPEVTRETAERFRDAGYRVHLVALAVPAWQSRAGILDRYVTDHGAGRSARITELAAHDAGYHGTPSTIAGAIHAGVVDRLTLLDRGGAILLDVPSPTDPREAIEVLESERARVPAQLEQYITTLQAGIAYLESNGLVDERTAPLIAAARHDVAVYGNKEARDAFQVARQGIAIPAPLATTARSEPRHRRNPGVDAESTTLER